MPSTISAGTTAGTAIAVAGDTTGNLAFQTNGTTTAMTIDTSQNVGIGTASPSSKLEVIGPSSSVGTISWQNQSRKTGYLYSDTSGVAIYATDLDNAGIYLVDDNRIGFFVNGSERSRIDSSGNLLVGTTSGAGRTTVNGSTADSTDNCISFRDSSSTSLFVIRNDGRIATGGSTGPYNNTTGSAANMFVDSNGIFFRSTSSLKYKRDVQDATHGLAEVLQLRPVTYKGKGESDGETVFGGLIAEEVHATGLAEFVQYAKDGSPDALAYGNMVSLMVKAIQELNAKVDAQASTITALEAKLTALENK
jgi:hypothetical protein